jgi:hypothetical protein
VIKPGFRHNKAQFTKNVAEELDLMSFTVAIPSRFCCKVRLEPSKEATFRILD